METKRDALAAAIAKRFPALLGQYSQFTVADFVVQHFNGNLTNAVAMVKAARSELAEWKQAASVEAGLRREFLTRAEKAEGERDALALQVLVLEQQRDEARARSGM
jgi:hypothetical protein